MNISNQFHTRRSLFKKCNIFESISHASSLFKKCKHLNSAFEEKIRFTNREKNDLYSRLTVYFYFSFQTKCILHGYYTSFLLFCILLVTKLPNLGETHIHITCKFKWIAIYP